MTKCERKSDVANRTWRPFLFWGLSIVSILGFPLLTLVATLEPTVDLTQLVIAFGAVLATVTSGAYIREQSKNNNKLVDE
jgi:hypothetical protein